MAKVAVQCSADTFVVNQTFVLRINFSGKNPALRVAANRYALGKKTNMIITRLYTDYAFDSKKKAEDLFQFLKKYPLIISLQKYGVYEPLKHVFKSGRNTEAIEMLTGYDVGRSGDILLKGQRNKFLCWIRWCEGGRIMEWTFWFDDIILKKGDLKQHFLQFIADTSHKFNIIFGGIAIDDEWKAKHWEITKHKDGGETETKKGLDWEGYLTGIYWTTIFGERLFEKFIKNNEHVSQYIFKNNKNTDNVVLIMLDKNPFNFKLKERLKTDKELMTHFGEKHFFDIKKIKKKLTKVKL